jgi:hypothetical protein
VSATAIFWSSGAACRGLFHRASPRSFRPGGQRFFSGISKGGLVSILMARSESILAEHPVNRSGSGRASGPPMRSGFGARANGRPCRPWRHGSASAAASSRRWTCSRAWCTGRVAGG